MVPPGATVRGGGGEHKKVEVGLREGRWVGQNWKKKKVGYGLFRRKKRDRTREKKDESQEEESKSVRREAREKKG